MLPPPQKKNTEFELLTCVMDDKISSRLSPLPSRTPTVRFLDRFTKEVSMISPTPAIPVIVDASAPIRTASHRISAVPCATRAESALFPSPSPSTIPAAMATTFFSAPPISTPITSLVTFTRSVGEAKTCCTNLACLSSSDAATRLVGRPSITSLAKLGPDSATRGWSSPSALSRTSCMVRQEVTSRPLLTETTGTRGGTWSFTFSTKEVLAWTGMAQTMRSQPSSASAGEVVPRTFPGRVHSTRGLTWSSDMDLATSASRTSTVTAASPYLRARTVARAVPKAPPPHTATFSTTTCSCSS